MTSWQRVLVARKTLEAEDIASFELQSLSGSALPAYTPGAHIDVRTPGGEVRQYSLCSTDSTSGRYRIAVLREPHGRGGSRAMHLEVRAGDELEISAPRNHFELDAGAQFSVLLAGGIGITPVLSMAQQLQASNRPYSLDYCARSQERMAFRQEILDSAIGQRTRLHFDDGHQAQKLDIPATLRDAPPGAHLYVCGPRGFIDAVLASADALGWEEHRVHREFFTGSADALATGDSFEVVIASTQQVISIPSDRSVVEVLAGQGIAIETSCEQGVCGTCLTRILEGTPDHRDSFLTPSEQAAGDQFTPCCSRSKTARLVLDL